MAKTEDKSNKLYNTGFDNNIIPVTANKINMPAKVTTLNSGDNYTLFDAFNIDWQSGQYSYDGDPNHIIQSTGHLVELIKNGIGNGNVWDNTQDYIVFSVEVSIYKAAGEQPEKIEIQDIVNNTELNVETLFNTGYDGWVTSRQPQGNDGDDVWQSSIMSLYKYYTKEVDGHSIGDIEFNTWSEPIATPIKLETENIGIQGNYKSTCFTRTNIDISNYTVIGGEYNSGLPAHTRNASNVNVDDIITWSDGIPNGEETLWSVTGTFLGADPNNPTWTQPTIVMDNANYDIEFAFEDAEHPNEKPHEPIKSGQGANCNGSGENQIWYDPIDDLTNLPQGKQWSDMVWRAEQIKVNGVPGAWVITRIKGENGEAGKHGNFKSTVFTRSSEDISGYTVLGGDYDNPYPDKTYNGDEQVNIEWSDGIPSGTEVLWSTYRTFIDDETNSNEWAAPTIVSDTPTYDVEFSDEEEPGDPTHNPTNWYDPTDDLLTVDWTRMIWRAERHRASQLDDWGPWVITKIKGENGIEGKPANYYEQRWRVFVPGEQITLPDSNTIINDDTNNDWKLSQVYKSGKDTWMTTRLCEYYIPDGQSDWKARYVENSTWTPAIKITGTDGQSNPIHPVLKYAWYNSRTSAPATTVDATSHELTATDEDDNLIWNEQPGNPTSTNKYLWMIQGARYNNEYVEISNNVYWTTPICLSGNDGQTGVDGSDIEFIYYLTNSVLNFDNITDNSNPQKWYEENVTVDNTQTGTEHAQDYIVQNTGWTDQPTGISITNKYEYASYRQTVTVGTTKYWTPFCKPFAWSVYGETGLDGDGVEYIYATSNGINVKPSQPKCTTAEQFNASQTDEWGVDSETWFDDPQEVREVGQTHQWVSTRKFTTITNANYQRLCEGVTKNQDNYLYVNGTILKDKNNNNLKIGDKAWFPYSTPEIWNWYTKDGTNAPEIVMLYKRTANRTQISSPTKDENNQTTIVNSSTLGWADNPGNSSEGYEYLWMSSNYYTEYDSTTNKYKVTKNWSTPVCLTGEQGKEGNDGADIEFIYYRTADDNKSFSGNELPSSWKNDEDYQLNDFPFVGTAGIDYYVSEDGISTLLNKNHDTWSDNPQGITQTYDHEYCSIRTKSEQVWGAFCKPFLWSKYGEQGIDGDGVEYIYYQSPDDNEVTFGESDTKNPVTWFNYNKQSEYQTTPEYMSDANWSDDPKGVTHSNKYEYVSSRKFKTLTSNNISDVNLHVSTDNITLLNSSNVDTGYKLGDKMWFPYSQPALWSKYADDAVAINLTLESDNDMSAVSINDQHIVTDACSTKSIFTLYHNTRAVDTSYYSMTIIGTNDDTTFTVDTTNNQLKYGNTVIAELSLDSNTNKYALQIDIPKDLDMSNIYDELRISVAATITNTSFDTTNTINVNDSRPLTVKVKGLQLNLSDIYQLQLSRNAITLDAHQDPQPLTITLQSLTSTSKITTDTDATSNHLFVYYDNVNTENGPAKQKISIESPIICTKTDSSNNNAAILTHTFTLYYDIDNACTLTTPHGILLDEESVSFVFDGTDGLPGTDSKSQEFIYRLTTDVDHNFTGNDLPSSWYSATGNYQKDDYPFIGTNGANVISGSQWTDNPQSVSETDRYEWIATRSYNTSTKKWEAFSEPKIWSTWSKDGADGDGVEYIFAKFDASHPISFYTADNTNNPSTWFNYNNNESTETEKYQTNEYIHSNEKSIWKDDAKDIDDLNEGEGIVVSIRKFKAVHDTNKGELPGFDDQSTYDLGYKLWWPYSTPKLWSKIGESIQGEPGGSGVVVDFDNDNLQLAVNSDNTIKGDNVTETGIHIYDDSREIPITSVAINSVSGENTQYFSYSKWATDNEHKYVASNVGKTFIGYLHGTTTNGVTSYIYKVRTIEGQALDDTIPFEEQGKRIQFKITYNGVEHFKTLTVSGLHYGIDGAPAETFELRIPVSEIHYDTQNNASPTSITPKIWHHKGGDVAPVNELLEKHSNYKFSYIAYLKSSGLQAEYTQPKLNTKLVVSIPNDGNTSYITWRLKSSTGNIVDEETTYAVFDGSNGRDSYSDEYIYYLTTEEKLSWSNDENPSQWTTYQGKNINEIADFPWSKITTNSYLGWTDNPQGVDDVNTCEYYAHRSYDYVNNHWTVFDGPHIWSKYGSDGRDGDGVEYIYRVFQTKTSFSNNKNNPNSYLWFTNSNYQTGFEYIYSGSLWYDNPQTVDGTNKYQYVSVRRYKKLTSDSYTSYISNQNYIKNYVTLVNNELKVVSDGTHIAYTGEKIWFPYSTPKLWSSYGDTGPQGPSGSNAFILDWDNDQINLAVNNLGYVLSSQSKTSTLSIYNNSNIKMWNDSTHQTTYSSDFDVNKMSLTNDWKDNRINLSYSVKNNSELEAKIITKTISNHNDYTYIPEGGIEITFDIPIETKPGTYITASKVLKICGQHTAVDGTQGNDAVTYELVPNYNSIIYDSNTDFTSPETITYTVFKYKGETITTLSSTSFGNSICYVSYQYGPSTEQHTTINTPIKTGVQLSNADSLAYSYMNMILNKKVGSSWKEIDKETIPILKNGENGEPGTGSFVVEFSNDQVNFAVNQNRVIETQHDPIATNEDAHEDVYGQAKSNPTKLHLISENSDLILKTNNIEFYLDDYSEQTYQYNVVVDEEEFLNNYNKIFVDYNLSSDSKALEIVSIKMLEGMVIPTEGITIYIKIQVYNNVSGLGTYAYKAFKIMGQYIPQNGNNAVTYEIVPSANSVSYTIGGSAVPSTITSQVVKYDGSNVSTINVTSPLSVVAYWGNSSSSANFNGSVSANNAGKYSYIQFNLLYNSTLIDSETIPIVKNGQKGEEGPQGISGPIVRMCGEYNTSRYYGDGTHNNNYNGTDILYKDIVTYSFTSGGTSKTQYYTPKYNRDSKSYISSTNTYLCIGNGYVRNKYPASSTGDTNTDYWVVANQFEFVATKLLYADQALINQISSHDFIATKSNGYPVAGITTGHLDPVNSSNDYSLLNHNNNSGAPNNINQGENTDNASVRIFAGEIKKDNKYSLTYAPFNVRQDGTAYMSKAIVSGDITAESLQLKEFVDEISDPGEYRNGTFALFDNVLAPNDGQKHKIDLPIVKAHTIKQITVLSTNGYASINGSGGKYSGVYSSYTVVHNGNEKTKGGFIAEENIKGNLYYGLFEPKKWHLYTFIGVNNSDYDYYNCAEHNNSYLQLNNREYEKYSGDWYITEVPLSPTSEPEYKLVDVSNDVTLLGWSIDSDNYSRWMDSEEYYTEHETTSDYDMGWGPRVRYVDNNTNVFEFYTYLNVDNDTDITGAMCNFGSLYWFNTGSISNN